MTTQTPDAVREAVALTIADAGYHLRKYRPHCLEALEQALAALNSRAGDAGEGVPTINDDQVYRLRKVAEAECGCRIPAPFDEVADHVAKIAFDEAVKRCRVAATPAPAVDAQDVWRRHYEAMEEAAGRLKGAVRPQLDAMTFADHVEVRKAFNDIAVVSGRALDTVQGKSAPAVDAGEDRHPGWTERGHAWLNAGAPVVPAIDAVPAGEVEFNGSIGQAQRALRFLAENDRPIGGEEFANAASLEQIADDLEVTRKRLASLSHGEGRK